MSPKKKPLSDFQALRGKAEESLKTTSMQVKKMSMAEIQHFVHELQVHQIELEIQNEELRRTQLELQYARDRYADLYDFAPVGFLTLNTSGEILEANLTACQLLQVERKDLIHQKLEAFVIAADQSTLRLHLQNLVQRNLKEVSGILRLTHNHEHFLVRLQSLFEDQDGVHAELNIRVALLDLTEQELAKALQKEQEAWLSDVLDTAMDAIITIDEQERVVLFNKGAEEMFRCPPSEAIGKSIDPFIPQQFRPIHQAHVQAFMQSGERVRSGGRLGNVVARRFDGEEFSVEASISQFDFAGQKRLTVILRDITERRKVEEALAKEQQFTATILDATAALVVVLDPKWRIVRFNQVCERVTGRTIDEMKGKSFLDLTVVSGEDAPEVKSLLSSFQGKQFPTFFENAWLDRDRQVRWISWSNTVIKDQQGEVENIIATGIDITRRKQAELASQRLATQNRLILDSAGEGIYGIDHQGHTTFFNRAAEVLTGWNFQDVEGRAIHSHLHHTRKDGTPYPWDECPVYFSATNGSYHHVDTEILWRKDGTSFPVAYTCSPIKNIHHQVEGVVVTFADITARKKAEDALRESEERFQAFMNHSPAVKFLKNEKGQYVYVNRQFEKKLHLSQANCLGKTDLQLFPPEVARIFKEHDQEVLKTREVLEAEETTLDETGKVRYWWVMKFLVHRRRGEVQLGGVALDITARKEVEEALRVREGELQHSHEALQALGGELITAQEDERRRISRELHDDMNQRLAVLALTIQSVQKELGQSTPTYQALQKLYDAVSLLSDDVRRLAYQLHPSILDDLGLEVALQAFISDFSKWEGIPVSFVATDVPFSVAQEIASCLYRVTQECLRNVTKHAQATQVDVKLIGKDDALTLSISDNGKGFTVETMLGGKHGLGLISMQERVRAVQGTYNLRSAPGQGTEIIVWVPTMEVKREK